jgi:hypothetical protein
MATSAKKQTEQPKSGLVAVYKLNDNGKRQGNPHYASADAKWVREGLENGTVQLAEEVAPDASQVSAQGDAAASGDSVNA